MNSVLNAWLLWQLTSEVKLHLICSYCTSLYGCERWNLSMCPTVYKMAEECPKSFKFTIANTSYLIPLLCHSLLTSVGWQWRLFVHACNTTLVLWNYVTWYSVLYMVVTVHIWDKIKTHHSVCEDIIVFLMTYCHVTYLSIL